VADNRQRQSIEGIEEFGFRLGNSTTSFNNPQEEVIIMARQDAFDLILSKLSGAQGSDGCIIVSQQGEVIAANISKGFSQDKIAALAADAVTIANRVTSELNYGVPETMIVESSRGKFALIHAQKAGAFIIAIGSETMNVGMLKMDLKDAIDSFDGEMR
jgi:predicted regulator of Ras-like GTPase activity (Roadblock/LC7/MglB family)